MVSGKQSVSIKCSPNNSTNTCIRTRSICVCVGASFCVCDIWKYIYVCLYIYVHRHTNKKIRYDNSRYHIFCMCVRSSKPQAKCFMGRSSHFIHGGGTVSIPSLQRKSSRSEKFWHQPEVLLLIVLDCGPGLCDARLVSIMTCPFQLENCSLHSEGLGAKGCGPRPTGTSMFVSLVHGLWAQHVLAFDTYLWSDQQKVYY